MGKKEYIIRTSSGVGFLSSYRKGSCKWVSDYQQAMKLDHQRAILILTGLEAQGMKANICKL